MNIVLKKKKLAEREKERKQRKMHSLLERLTNGRGSRVAGCMSRVWIESRWYDLDDAGAGFDVACKNDFA